MIRSTDVGSVFFEEDFDQYLDARTKLLYYSDGSALDYVGSIITKIFIEKAKRIDVPTYPQINGVKNDESVRLDMNEMFLQLINGIEKSKGLYKIINKLHLKQLKCYIPEVHVLEKNSKLIAEGVGREPVEYSICLAGPHCLSWNFDNRSSVNFEKLGYLLSRILEETVFSNNYIRLGRVSIDEPMLGESEDPNISYDNPSKREELLKSWKIICDATKSKGATTSMHLHSTVDKLFLEVGSLQVIQAHVDEHFYKSLKTKELLKDKDKKIFASICKTNSNDLIDQQLRNRSIPEFDVGQLNAEEWKKIKSGVTNPMMFLESEDVMRKGLFEIGNFYGWDRIEYAGPECGLKDLFSLDCNLEYLKRVGNVVRDANKEMGLNL
jgi:methionine synthase II (cobalamin-independent)